MLKKLIVFAALALSLSGCQNPPSAETVTITNAAIVTAEAIANAEATKPGVSPATTTRITQAETAVNQAWTTYQATLANGGTPDQAGLTAALIALSAAQQ